ncbi:hypothetical protein RBA16_27490, partial [Mycobacteroides abscessus subsp. massiliense]|uniref:hypothetical protein n=1 Tax=Mycobacteroides abscessus TaxID=36809 RepID=UPI003CF6D4D6
MTDKEIIARQAAEIIELKDKLAEAETVRNYWFNKAQHSIRVYFPSSVEEHNLIVDLLKRGT